MRKDITITGSAKVLSQPSLDGTTTIEDYDVTVTSPADTISFTFKVVNDGNYDASVSSVSVGTPECTGTDSTSNTNVCGNLSYTLTYEGGASVQTGDTLYAKDYAIMKVTLTYADFSDASLLPTADVSISGLGITINYQQSGSALVKDNGEVADYKVYHLGEKITINSADYYVMEDSGAGQDYIVSGVDGGMAYYTSETCGYVNDTLVISGCTTDYNLSDIKYVIDNWSNAVFQNEELKAVNGNKARLITIEEASRFGCSPNTAYSCKTPVYSDILKAYWTMIANPTSIFSMYSIYHQYSSWDSKVYSSSFAARVRSVINVYKSAIETNNNAE